MTDAVAAALITSAGGVIAGIVGVRGYDRVRGHSRSLSNGYAAVDKAISSRASVEFQTRMTLLMEQLTHAIEKGYDRSLEQTVKVSEAVMDAALAIKQVHEEIVQHRQETRPALGTIIDTQRSVREIQKQINREPAIGRRATD